MLAACARPDHVRRSGPSSLIFFLACTLLLTVNTPFPLGAAESRTEPASSLIPITTPDGLTILAELADTPEKRAVGLMERTELASNRGMLFTFPQPGYWSFWMKNTRIPLDILWLDQHKTIVYIEHSAPICHLSGNVCPQYIPPQEALYVLELRGGVAASLGLRPGAALSFDVPFYIPFRP